MADVTITPANVLASINATRLTLIPTHKLVGTDLLNQVPNLPIAGVAITAGQPVYQSTADNLFYLADANGADPLYKVVGIAENSASANQPISIVKEDPNFTPGFTMVIGDSYILSGNVGMICPEVDRVAGWRVSYLFAAYSTTLAAFKILRTDVAKA